MHAKNNKNHNLIDRTNPDMSRKWNNLSKYQKEILLRKAKLPDRYATVSYGNMALDKNTREKIRRQYVKNQEIIKELNKQVQDLRNERKKIMQNYNSSRLGRLDQINYDLPFIYTRIENLGGQVN